MERYNRYYVQVCKKKNRNEKLYRQLTTYSVLNRKVSFNIRIDCILHSDQKVGGEKEGCRELMMTEQYASCGYRGLGGSEVFYSFDIFVTMEKKIKQEWLKEMRWNKTGTGFLKTQIQSNRKDIRELYKRESCR